MPTGDTEVAIIGGGAAGIAAARRLRKALVDCLILEARPRLGGRAWTNNDDPASPIDLGCGWLHSADRNPWTKIAEAEGYSIDRTPPPWTRHSSQIWSGNHGAHLRERQNMNHVGHVSSFGSRERTRATS